MQSKGDAQDQATCAERRTSRSSRGVVFVLAPLCIILWTAGVMHTLRWGAGSNIDLHVYRDASRSWLSGHFGFNDRFGSVHLAYLYPPISLMMFSWLTWFTVSAASVITWLASCACLVVSIGLALARTSSRLSISIVISLALTIAGAEILLLEPIRNTLKFGQINLLLLALVTIDLLWMTNRVKGALIGVAAAIKLVPLVYVGAFITSKRWRAAITCLAMFVSLTALAWIIAPHVSDQYWFGHGLNAASKVGIGFRRNQSIFGAAARIFGRSTASTVIWSILSLSFIALWVAIVRRGLDSMLQFLLVTALVGNLISPISWSHHWVWVGLVPVVLFERSDTIRRLRPSMSLLLLVSIIAPYRWNSGYPLVVHLEQDSLLLAGCIVLIHWFVVSRGQPARSTVNPNTVYLRVMMVIW